MQDPAAEQTSRLRALREAAGLSRGELSRLSSVPARSIAAYESEGVDPSLGQASRLARALGCSLDELVAA